MLKGEVHRRTMAAIFGAVLEHLHKLPVGSLRCCQSLLGESEKEGKRLMRNLADK